MCVDENRDEVFRPEASVLVALEWQCFQSKNYVKACLLALLLEINSAIRGFYLLDMYGVVVELPHRKGLSRRCESRRCKTYVLL